MTRGKRQQRDVPRLLDRAGQAPLVRGAHARQTAGHNLAALGHKTLQQPHIAVGDRIDLLGAELAHLLATEKLAASAGPPPGRPPGRGPDPDPEPGPPEPGPPVLGPDDAGAPRSRAPYSLFLLP